ncbi:MAG: hypothetical protein QXO30_02710 [Candidatus Caldarchaeum sp.]
MVAGVVDGKPVFMLSGYPVPALTGFQLFVKYGHNSPGPCRVRGKLTSRVVNHTAARLFMRVRLAWTQDGVLVEPFTGSGLLSTLTNANGLPVVPEEVKGYDEGAEVEVLQHG